MVVAGMALDDLFAPYMVLYPGDDHGLTRHAPQALDRLYAWSTGLLGTGDGASDSRAADAGGPPRR